MAYVAGFGGGACVRLEVAHRELDAKRALSRICGGGVDRGVDRLSREGGEIVIGERVEAARVEAVAFEELDQLGALSWINLAVGVHRLEPIGDGAQPVSLREIAELLTRELLEIRE